MANEVAVSGKSEAEIGAFLDKISGAMVAIVKSGLAAPPSTLPGDQAQDEGRRGLQARDGRQVRRQRGIGVVSAYALAGSEENARGHLVVTAPTGGSAGVIPAIVHALGEGGRKLSQQKIREGLLAARSSATRQAQRHALGAEGGCQAEIGVASRWGRPRLPGARRASAGRRERRRVRHCSTTSA